MNTWETMETAPLDQRILLKYNTPFFTKVPVVIGKYDSNDWACTPKPFWTNDLVTIAGVTRTRDNQPDFWMHIPD